MDVIEYLETEHRKFEALFATYEGLGEKDLENKGKIVAQIIESIEVHMELENTILYPAFKPVAEEEMTVDEAYEEHHSLTLLLNELRGLAPDAARYDAKVQVVNELNTHHVKEEERDMFPEVREKLSHEIRDRLGAEMVAAKPAVRAALIAKVA